MKIKFIAVLVFSLFICSKASAVNVDQLLKINIKPFEAIDFYFSYAIDEKAYSLNSKLTTTGIFGKIYPFSGIYKVEGKVEKGNLYPRKYDNYTKSRFNERKRQFLYDDKGIMTYRIIEKNDEVKKIEIDPKIAAKGKNLPTILAELIKQIKNTGTCASSYTVFNGKRTYNIIFVDYGFETLSDTDNPLVDGMTVKCSMYIEEKEENNGNLMFNASIGRPVMFWVKKDTETGWPYVAKIEATYSKFGRISIYPDSVKIKGY